jgi:hypothetical protein
MKPQTTQEISWVMKGYVPAAAIGTAMELGLFWLLEEKPLGVQGLSGILGIPFNRCYYWLEYLMEMGLLEKGSAGYSPSATAREAILGAWSQESWAFLAGRSARTIAGCSRPFLAHP